MGSTAFLTLIKSRDALQWKKYDEKKGSHELKAGGGGGQEGGDGQRQTNRQLLTNSCTEHFTDREGEREREGRRRRKKKREHPSYKNGKSTF